MTDGGRWDRRMWGRLIAAVLYGVCILAPHAALAVGQAAHCVTDSTASRHHHEIETPAPHEHAGGSDHHHADVPTPAAPASDTHAGTCCGLFCLTGLATAPAVTMAAPAGTSRVVADRDRSMDGRGPDRIIRPPKA